MLSILLPSVLPSSPLIHGINVSYGIAEFSVRLQWQYPSDDGGAIIDNYTFKLYQNDALIEILNTSLLEYYVVDLTNYSVSISAVNCAGAGNPIMQHIFDIVYQTITFFSSAGCSAPLSPASGVIDEYTSTEEGSQIQFHCSETNNWNTSVCMNTSWSPDPQTLVCMQNPTGILSFKFVRVQHFC